jgi:uncharacterized membrane protein
MASVLFLTGLAAVVVGVGLIYLPAGIITFGAILALGSANYERAEQ